MEMQQVRYFLALSSTLSFTRAAEECNVTQPALTRAIKTLEEGLGGERLRRQRQHSHLTELGRRMLPLIQQCYDAATSAKSLAKAVQSSDVAPLNVGEWNDMDSLAAARPQMIGLLDTMRDMLEDLGGDLGVTDPVSGTVVAEIGT